MLNNEIVENNYWMCECPVISNGDDYAGAQKYERLHYYREDLLKEYGNAIESTMHFFSSDLVLMMTS